jgi:hypothetical protein
MAGSVNFCILYEVSRPRAGYAGEGATVAPALIRILEIYKVVRW